MTTKFFSVTLEATEFTAGSGLLWSHAVSLGPLVYSGRDIDITPEMVENFVRVFSSGYPSKVPVDYEHGSMSDDPAVAEAAARGDVPAAGHTAAMKAVLSVTDFTGELLAQATVQAAKAGRTLSDPRNLGLWICWQPTDKARARIQSRELTEMSIAWTDDMIDGRTGQGQGPGIFSVALCMRPFVEGMLSVAATAPRSGAPGAGRSAPPTGDTFPHTPMSKIALTAVVTALVGTPQADDEQALVTLSTLQPQIAEMRQFHAVIGAELDERDPVKAATKLKALKTELAAAKATAEETKKAAISEKVDATLKTYEKRIGNVALRKLLSEKLTAELTAGVELEKTDAFQSLKALPGTAANLSQGSHGKTESPLDEAPSDEEQLAVIAEELMRKDPVLREMHAKRGYSTAYLTALNMAKDKMLEEAGETGDE